MRNRSGVASYGPPRPSPSDRERRYYIGITVIIRFENVMVSPPELLYWRVKVLFPAVRPVNM
jgi:hypothetical protein